MQFLNPEYIENQNFYSTMALVNCIQFSYLGTTRYIICDLDTRYEEIQNLVARAFGLPSECITALQFTDGKGYILNKNLFENFLLLFPQPQQKFYVRLECSRILENRAAYKEGKREPFGRTKDNNKRKHRDMQETETEKREPTVLVYAAPVRRQNCFLGSLPDNNNNNNNNNNDETTTVESNTSELSASTYPQRKRMRMEKSNKIAMKRFIKPRQPKRALRM